MSVVIIGKNSFLAGHLAKNEACKDWLFLTHQEALDNSDWLENANLIINFAFARSMQIDEYDALLDIDSILAEKLINRKHIHYIMISSRAVYGHSQYENFILKESQIPKPFTAFGQAKQQIEQSLISILGKERLSILRLGDIFGFEPGRHSFFGNALLSLKNENKIVLNVAPHAIHDFLAAWHFTSMLIRIVNNPVPGLFNIGSGFGTPYIKVAEWLIHGYGQGEIITEGTSESGQFWMDMSKTKKWFDLDLITPEILADDCIRCGYELRTLSGV